jgi:hypothetical protein
MNNPKASCEFLYNKATDCTNFTDIYICEICGKEVKPLISNLEWLNPKDIKSF